MWRKVSELGQVLSRVLAQLALRDSKLGDGERRRLMNIDNLFNEVHTCPKHQQKRTGEKLKKQEAFFMDGRSCWDEGAAICSGKYNVLGCDLIGA